MLSPLGEPMYLVELAREVIDDVAVGVDDLRLADVPAEIERDPQRRDREIEDVRYPPVSSMSGSFPGLIRNKSLPDPPTSVSSPWLETSVSLPVPPTRLLFPGPATSRSLPVPPISVSLLP